VGTSRGLLRASTGAQFGKVELSFLRRGRSWLADSGSPAERYQSLACQARSLISLVSQTHRHTPELCSAMNSNNGNTDFGAFVKRQQTAAAEGERVDWAKQRDEWLVHLHELYDLAESFLAEYTKTGDIKVSYRDIPLNEEHIGSYSARQMILKIGCQEIALTPVGTLFFYIKGRVDVVGPAGQTRLVLVDSESLGPPRKVTVSIGKPNVEAAPPKEIKWAWKIATSPPIIQYIELTQESLFEALMEVANG